MPPWSSGLGHRPLTAVTGVRIPWEVPYIGRSYFGFADFFIVFCFAFFAFAKLFYRSLHAFLHFYNATLVFINARVNNRLLFNVYSDFKKHFTTDILSDIINILLLSVKSVLYQCKEYGCFHAVLHFYSAGNIINNLPYNRYSDADKE